MKRARRVIAILLILLLLIAVGGWLYLRSDAFRESLRVRVVSEIERASGGKATLRAFDFDWARNRATLTDLTVRGREPASAPPLLHLDSAEAALSITSYLGLNANLRSIRLTGLAVNLITFADGTTNLPGPATPSTGNPVDPLLRMAISRFELQRSSFSWNLEKYPLAMRGEELEIDLRYRRLPTATYAGHVSSKRVSIEHAALHNAKFDVDADVAIEREALRLPRVRLVQGKTEIDAKGVVNNWRQPVLDAAFTAKGNSADVANLLAVKLPANGSFETKGSLSYRADRGGLRVEADAEGRDWVITAGGQSWGRAAWSAHAVVENQEARLTAIRVDLPAGVFRGTASSNFESYQVQGTVGSIQLTELQRFVGPDVMPWQGFVTGPIRIEGTGPNAEVSLRLNITPNDSERAIEGKVSATYSTRTGVLDVETAHLETYWTTLDASGSLDQRLNVRLDTNELTDLPYSDRIPVRLEGTNARAIFVGAIIGTLTNPTIDGTLEVDHASAYGESIDRVSGRVRATRGGLAVERLMARQGEMEVTGQGSLTLFDGEIRDWSAVRANLQAKGAGIPKLLKLAKLDYDADGVAAGDLEISGTIGDPRANGTVRVERARYGQDELGQVSATVRYSAERIEIERGQLSIDQRPAYFSGSFTPDARRSANGTFRLDVRTSGVNVERISWVRERQPDFEARVDVDAKTAGRIQDGQVTFSSLNGQILTPAFAYRKRALGSLNLKGVTAGDLLKVTTTGNLRGASINSSSSWKISDPKLTGSGDFQIVNLRLADFEDFLGAPETKESTEPVVFAEGSMRLTGRIQGSLMEPEKLKGNMRIENLELAPRQLAGAVKRDLTLRSPAPIDVDFDERGLSVKSARLEAKNTSLTASGLVALSRTGSSNLRLQGNVNLEVLSIIKPDLQASGDSVVDASFRGSFGQPQITGRMEFRNASFFLRNVPNGLEGVNGVVFFDRTRARIESFTAQSGGGTLRLAGFVGFGNELTYQLQASGENVRVRYPEGISTSVNAALSLAGGASSSVLSGSVTILRMALAPRADIGTMIAEGTKATTSGPPRFENEFLKEMQIDVRVDTALDAELTSSLTQNVQAEVNLRIRGTPARPVVLGRVSFTQGDLNFFGAKYSIDRGEINFYNQTKIEPVINLDLQTRIRGVLVTITFSGPANKLNLSYRSDPPLQSSEILALLTVGRAPDNPTIASGSTVQSPTFLQGASSALLGQAATAPITGRLQRLFGVSRVRIDPQLTGIENTAQARLTIEQQVSRDITVTFITNLNRTQQQIVSVEWDFSRDFSAVAIRDDNGVFGLDFFYRKRFK